MDINFNQPLNPIFRRSDVIIRQVDGLSESRQLVRMTLPFYIQLPDNTWWLLPYEPLVSISGENVITKRNVAKSEGRGTIKERWTEGDIKITIEGTFANANQLEYPAVELEKLRSAVTQRRAIGIQHEILCSLDVNYIVVENFNIPFTKGENMQNYSITALSDDSYNLFIEVK